MSVYRLAGLAFIAGLAIVAGLGLVGCGRTTEQAPAATEAAPTTPYRIFLVLDTVDDWSAGVRDGFTKRMDGILATAGRQAVYTIVDTGLNPATAEEILLRIRGEKPDLVVAAVYPNGFAALTILQKLKADGIPCLAMEATPVEDGTIASTSAPGGHISGVGVFLQMNSLLRVARRIDPGLRRVYYLSWSAMAPVNA